MKKLLLLLFLIPNLAMAYGRMGGGDGLGGFVIIMAFLIWYNWDNIWNILGIILLVFITSVLLWQSLSEGNFSIVFLLAAIFLTVKNWDKLKNIYQNIFAPPESKTTKSKTTKSKKINRPLSTSEIHLLISMFKQCIQNKGKGVIISFDYASEIEIRVGGVLSGTGVKVKRILLAPYSIDIYRHAYTGEPVPSDSDIRGEQYKSRRFGSSRTRTFIFANIRNFSNIKISDMQTMYQQIHK